MEQKIEFVAMSELQETFEDTELFQFRSDRSFHWLQEACFFVLRKLRAFHIGHKSTIERHLIDSDGFIDKLFKQQEGIEQFFHRRPTDLLIGAEDYAKLMKEAASTQAFNFNAHYGYRREILGMTVHVIPWMRGVLVMPDTHDEIRFT